MPSGRVTRGRQTQVLLADYLRKMGLFPHAESRPASLPGTDIMHTPEVAIEVKATEGQDFISALKQAVANGGSNLPLVVYRPRGYGPERIEDWIVALRLCDAVNLLRDAEYGA